MDIRYIELSPLEDEQLAGVESEEWQVHPEKDGTYWVGTEDTFVAGDMTLENARLLAAGPKMLEALKRMLERFDFGEQFPCDHPIVAARAAIAEATGGAA